MCPCAPVPLCCVLRAVRQAVCALWRVARGLCVHALQARVDIGTRGPAAVALVGPLRLKCYYGVAMTNMP